MQSNKEAENVCQQHSLGGSCDLADSTINVLPLSPVEELLILHPAPWQCVPASAWQGADPPDNVIFDAKGHLVDIIDDPNFRPAIVNAVNIASAMVAGFDERVHEHCNGISPQGGK